MTKHFHLLFLFVSIAGIGFSASAIELIDTFKTDASVYRVFPEKTEREKTVKSTKLIGMNVPDSLLKSTSDSAYAMIGKFYADQFRNFQDPRAPYFMFMSKMQTLPWESVEWSGCADGLIGTVQSRSMVFSVFHSDSQGSHGKTPS